MSYLLAFSRLVDAFNQKVGIVTCWMILLCTLISAGNALMRYAFNSVVFVLGGISFGRGLDLERGCARTD